MTLITQLGDSVLEISSKFLDSSFVARITCFRLDVLKKSSCRNRKSDVDTHHPYH